MEELLNNTDIYKIYLILFVFYFALSYVLRKFVVKAEVDLKANLINSLLGLLVFTIYMAIFAN